jgi:hypothetical protein
LKSAFKQSASRPCMVDIEVSRWGDRSNAFDDICSPSGGTVRGNFVSGSRLQSRWEDCASRWRDCVLFEGAAFEGGRHVMKSLLALSPPSGSAVSAHCRALRVFTLKAEPLVTRRKPRPNSCRRARPATDLERPIFSASRTA